MIDSRRILTAAVVLFAAVVMAGSGQPQHYKPNEPQQIHTAASSDDATRSVSWTTLVPTPESVVEFGVSPDSLNVQSIGRSFEFVDGNVSHRAIWIHNAVFGSESLTPATRYYYRVGDPSLDVWSDVYNFTTFSADYPKLDVLVYGDLGVVNDQSQTELLAEIARHTPEQFIIHVGDFAYDLHYFNGERGDAFMNQIQPLAAYVPYQTCAGNHEQAYNFSHYTNRFSLISDISNTGNNWHFSYDLSYVHFVSINVEVYYTDTIVDADIIAQYEWLTADLAAVDRTKTPWIVVYGHRPLYCSNNDDIGDCTTDAQLLRDGMFINGVQYGLDDVFFKYGVDLYLTAHEHSYERTLPVYASQVDTDQSNGTYINPKYTTHIIAGAAGCQELLQTFSNVTWGNFSLIRSASYGYGHLRLANATHLHWTQFLAEGADGVDDLWLVKTDARVRRRTEPESKPEYSPLRTPLERRMERGDYCDRYCVGVCQRYHPLTECATKCRCQALITAAYGVDDLGAECTLPHSLEATIQR